MSLLLGLRPAVADLRLDDLLLTPTAAVAVLVSTAAAAACPRCGTASDRLHSHYRRTVADLPYQDRPLALRLVVRRFRRARPDCAQSVFRERLPGLLEAHSRSTIRLTGAHRAIGLALGGEAGHRLADELDMPTSADTLLRRVKDAPEEPVPPPRYVGIDDWALRQGQRYGTIIIDLERGWVLDLLPGRDGDALQQWLQDHPGVEVITRDRWAAFAQAAKESAPQAQQVADRWHLLKNLREVVEQLLGKHTAQIRTALQETAAVAAPAANPIAPPTAPPPDEPASRPSTPLTVQQPARQARQQERVRQYERVRELRSQNLSLREIARVTGLSVKRVIRSLRSDRCPDWNPGRKTPTQLDPFAGFIDGWIERGGSNAANLFRELTGQGFRGSYDAVRRCLARRLGSAGRPGPRVGPLSPPAAPAPPSARKLSFEFVRRPEARTTEEQTRLDKLRGREGALREALDLAEEFAAMVRKRSALPLAEWLAKVEATSCAELQNFAAGLRADEAAVTAALTEAWSNGAVEGHVNRLQVLKRQMYGRAGLALLRARVRKAG